MKILKKIFILIACVALVLTLSVGVFAEGEEIPETPAEESSGGFSWIEVKDTVSGYIVGWVQNHPEEVSVCVTLVVFIINSIFRTRSMNKNMGVLNNNAVTMAKTSSESMENALALMQDTSGAVVGYDERITALLAAYSQTAQSEQLLRTELDEMKDYLKISAAANLEFSNELAELLALANIPNYKKEELGARHAASVKAISDKTKSITARDAVEVEMAEATEVSEDDGEEA